MATMWTVCCVLLLLLGAVMADQVYEEDKTTKKLCREEDLTVHQWEVRRGRHPQWKVEVRSSCAACEASVVELRCPGWVEGKAIEGYMYPVELLSPGLCMVGAPVTPSRPFSTVYHQPSGHIPLSVASVRFTCPPPHRP